MTKHHLYAITQDLNTITQDLNTTFQDFTKNIKKNPSTILVRIPIYGRWPRSVNWYILYQPIFFISNIKMRTWTVYAN